MNLYQTFRVAFRSLWANKLRSSLAMLGVVIGVAAVIAIMSIGSTFKGQIAGEFNKFGAATLFVMPGGGDGLTSISPVSTLTFEDEKAIAAQPGVEMAGGMVQLSLPFKVEGLAKPVTGMILGANEHFETLRSWEVEKGRFYTKAENESKAKVAVIGTTMAKKLFGEGTDPLGKTIELQGDKLEVIGVLKEQTLNAGQDINQIAVLPIDYISAKMEITRPSMIMVRYTSPDQAKAGKAGLERLLEERHGEKDFTVQSQEELLSAFGKILDQLALFIGAVAGIALLVGGIGIMNIMLVSVKERTREIGVRKAIGARPSDILLQFLVEAAALSLVGGAIGIALGLGGAAAGAAALSWSFVPSYQAIGLAVGFSTAVGIFFGFYPAWSASRLPAVEALRYE
jgi:putative ABC transport system permease protein